MSNAWIHCWRPRPHAHARLFAFPYAGAGASVFRTWHEELPPEIEVCGVQLPGRETRINEAPVAELRPLIHALAAGLGPKLDRPSVFFGHSFGAVLAFELAAHLHRRGERVPKLLMLSARPAPQLTPRIEPLHTLPREEFIDAVARRYRAIPAAILAEPELVELYLPLLLADITLSERHRDESAPFEALPIPIRALGGRADTLVPPEDLEPWRALTSREFDLAVFDGGHFFLNEEAPRKSLLSSIARSVGEIIG